MHYYMFQNKLLKMSPFSCKHLAYNISSHSQFILTAFLTTKNNFQQQTDPKKLILGFQRFGKNSKIFLIVKLLPTKRLQQHC